mmetsp:Transcript_17990/g.58856  ORF Transcript_17990/g.58856 Transcript_17990/m.58856 type:complete len:219 (+) Transcript_17990:683-1339(+)
MMGEARCRPDWTATVGRCSSSSSSYSASCCWCFAAAWCTPAIAAGSALGRRKTAGPRTDRSSSWHGRASAPATRPRRRQATAPTTSSGCRRNPATSSSPRRRCWPRQTCRRSTSRSLWCKFARRKSGAGRVSDSCRFGEPRRSAQQILPTTGRRCRRVACCSECTPRTPRVRVRSTSANSLTLRRQQAQLPTQARRPRLDRHRTPHRLRLRHRRCRSS